ncbi:MAG TPA: type IV toxin-antitoxin system AbiEi family antitoxin domain-containing protein, partial [bacterium]|nr:type IV toxin-antitoxin system AbiEi family antitoxin domain-containing protein [bacterium]
YFLPYMKSSSAWPQWLERVARLGPLQGGVFSYADLFNLLSAGSELQNKRAIRRLVREKVLRKVQRGFYTAGPVDLWVLATRLKPGAYVSMDSVLAKNGLVGTVPERSVSAVRPGSTGASVQTPEGSLRYFGVRKDLAFGFAPRADGVLVADSEKAFIDLLYYYQKGARFVFDPRSEIKVRKLDPRRLKKYLQSYRNPKFLKFVEGVLR